MAPLERKNGWTISEASGARSPDSVQWLLTGADWDPDLLRDDLRDWVAAQLGDPSGVLVVRRHRLLEEGHHVRGGAAAVLRDRGADRELSDRGVPGLRHPGRAHAARPRALSAESLD